MSENQVIWHPYPQEKPINSGSYLVSVIDEGKMNTLVTLWISQLNMFFAETDMMVTA